MAVDRTTVTAPKVAICIPSGSEWKADFALSLLIGLLLLALENLLPGDDSDHE